MKNALALALQEIFDHGFASSRDRIDLRIWRKCDQAKHKGGRSSPQQGENQIQNRQKQNRKPINLWVSCPFCWQKQEVEETIPNAQWKKEHSDQNCSNSFSKNTI